VNKKKFATSAALLKSGHMQDKIPTSAQKIIREVLRWWGSVLITACGHCLAIIASSVLLAYLGNNPPAA
jgi:hypothetical protein